MDGNFFLGIGKKSLFIQTTLSNRSSIELIYSRYGDLSSLTLSAGYAGRGDILYTYADYKSNRALLYDINGRLKNPSNIRQFNNVCSVYRLKSFYIRNTSLKELSINNSRLAGFINSGKPIVTLNNLWNVLIRINFYDRFNPRDTIIRNNFLILLLPNILMRNNFLCLILPILLGGHIDNLGLNLSDSKDRVGILLLMYYLKNNSKRHDIVQLSSL